MPSKESSITIVTMLSPFALLLIINTITLVLGGIVTVMAYRAYRRTGTPSLRALSVGIGMITFGTAVGGLLHQVFEMELIAGIIVQNLCITVGFAWLVYSLWLPTELQEQIRIPIPLKDREI